MNPPPRGDLGRPNRCADAFVVAGASSRGHRPSGIRSAPPAELSLIVAIAHWCRATSRSYLRALSDVHPTLRWPTRTREPTWKSYSRSDELLFNCKEGRSNILLPTSRDMPPRMLARQTRAGVAKRQPTVPSMRRCSGAVSGWCLHQDRGTIRSVRQPKVGR